MSKLMKEKIKYVVDVSYSVTCSYTGKVKIKKLNRMIFDTLGEAYHYTDNVPEFTEFVAGHGVYDDGVLKEMSISKVVTTEEEIETWQKEK